jgi:hypothetical protein
MFSQLYGFMTESFIGISDWTFCFYRCVNVLSKIFWHLGFSWNLLFFFFFFFFCFLERGKTIELTGALDFCTKSLSKFILLEVVCARKLKFQHSRLNFPPLFLPLWSWHTSILCEHCYFFPISPEASFLHWFGFLCPNISNDCKTWLYLRIAVGRRRVSGSLGGDLGCVF